MKKHTVINNKNGQDRQWDIQIWYFLFSNFLVYWIQPLLKSAFLLFYMYVSVSVCFFSRMTLYPSDWDHEFCLSRHTLFKEDPCIPSHLLYLLIRRTRTILNGKCSPAVFSEYIPFQTQKPIHKILSHSNKNIRWRPF